MAIISKSNKLGNVNKESKISAGKYVLFRIIETSKYTYNVETATASEDSGILLAYPDQASLIITAKDIFSGLGQSTNDDKDTSGRDYVRFHNIKDAEPIRAAANRVAAALNLDPATCVWTAEAAQQEGTDRWHELSVNEVADPDLYGSIYDSGYMEGGAYIDRRGRIIFTKK